MNETALADLAPPLLIAPAAREPGGADPPGSPRAVEEDMETLVKILGVTAAASVLVVLLAACGQLRAGHEATPVELRRD